MLHEDDELNVNAESAATLISLCAQEGPSLLSPGVVEGVANGGTIHIVTASLPKSSPTTNIVQVVTTASVTATRNLGVNKLRRKIHCTMCGLDGTQCLGAHNKKKCFQLQKGRQ